MITTACPPILFLIFNRPDLTERVFERIREIKPARLYIAADGPRTDRPGESVLCEETRAVTEAIDWDCEVHRLYRAENLGCKTAVSSAITWFFDQVESGIILEDDCLPDISFFRFCSELLERYREDDSMGLIAGTSFIDSSANAESYRFSLFPEIWGWATWRRTWEFYDVTMASWPDAKRTFRNIFPNPLLREYWSSQFQNTFEGSIDTWDYQLFYQLISRRKKNIIPAFSLVTNIGFDQRATHTTDSSHPFASPSSSTMDFPLAHPRSLAIRKPLEDDYISSHFNIPISSCRAHIVHKIIWLRICAGRIRRLLSRTA